MRHRALIAVLLALLAVDGVALFMAGRAYAAQSREHAPTLDHQVIFPNAPRYTHWNRSM